MIIKWSQGVLGGSRISKNVKKRLSSDIKNGYRIWLLNPWVFFKCIFRVSYVHPKSGIHRGLIIKWSQRELGGYRISKIAKKTTKFGHKKRVQNMVTKPLGFLKMHL